MIRMSTEGESSIFGRFIHETIPESLRVDPYAMEVTPRMELQKPSFSIREFTRNCELNPTIEESESEEAVETQDPNSVPLTPHEEVDPANTDLVEVDDEELGTSSREMNSSARSFSTFMFDIYQSASFSVPNPVVQQRSRLQYIQEYYRRMIHLLESSKKQIPASEETLSSLVIVVQGSVF